MSLLHSHRRLGFSILESLTLIAICSLLLIITVPVLLIRTGYWKPAKPVEVERPKDLVPRELRSADPDVKLQLPDAPRLPEDAKVPERLRTDLPKPTGDATPVLPALPESQPAKPAAASAPGPQAPATPPPAISPALPGEDAKK